MLHFFAARSSPISCQQNGTLVILMYQIVNDCEPLFNEEHPHPQHKSHRVVDANQLGFGGAPGVQFLFVGHIDDPPLANGHNGAGMTLHVRMDGE